MLQVHSFKDTRLKIKIKENAENHDSSPVFKAVAVAKKRSKKLAEIPAIIFWFVLFLKMESKIVKAETFELSNFNERLFFDRTMVKKELWTSIHMLRFLEQFLKVHIERGFLFIFWFR